MIQQWVYAYSCWNRPKQAGTPAGSGFGTYSWTDGLSLEDIGELERRCGTYKLPAGVVPHPDTAVRAGLPPAVQSFRLASGKRAIVRTVYVGEGFWDHRWGAILAHAMVKADGDWEGYPAEWMDSESFWKELPADVQAEALKSSRPPAPAALPELEDAAFVRSGHYGPERVAEHFREGKAREALVRLASLWAESGERPGNVLFMDDGKEAPWLVAGFSMLFPAWMAQNVAWATRRFTAAVPEEYRERWLEVAGADPRLPCARLEYVEVDPAVEAWVSTVEREREDFFGFLDELPGAKPRDWRQLLGMYRLVQGREGAVSLDEYLDYVRACGTVAAKRRVLEMLERRTELLPEPLTAEWMGRLLAACGDGGENDRRCARLLLEWCRRFEPGAAETCFLAWLRRGIGKIGEQWLAGASKGDGSTQGLLFTVAAAAHGAREDGANAAVEAALGLVEPEAGADWGAVLRFVAKETPEALAAVLAACPDAETADSWLQRAATDAESLVELAGKLRAADGSSGMAAARRAVAAYCAGRRGGRAKDFREVFRMVAERDADVAEASYAEAFKRGFPAVESAEDLTWLAEKAAWLPEVARAEYRKAIERSLPAGRAAAKELHGVLARFLAEKAAGEDAGLGEFLLWAYRAEQAPEEAAAGCANPGLAAVFAGLPTPVRAEWTEVLLPAFHEAIPDAPREGKPVEAEAKGAAAAHRVLLRFFLGKTGEEERQRFAEAYAGMAAEALGRSGRKHPAGNFRFGTLVRCVLGASDDMMAAVRRALLEEVYLKAKFTADDLAEERKAPALAKLSPEEEIRWTRLKAEYAALRDRNGLLARIGRWFLG